MQQEPGSSAGGAVAPTPDPDAPALVPDPRAPLEHRGPTTVAARLAGLVVLTYDWTADLVSGAGELGRLWGLGLQDSVGVATLAALLHPDDLAAVEQLVQAHRRGLQRGRLTLRVVLGPPAAHRQVHWSSELVRDAAGTATGIVLAVQDVTELLGPADAVDGLPTSPRFAELLSLARVAVAVVAEDGVVLDLNDSLASFVGRTPAEVRGRHVDSLLHPDDRSARAGESVTAGRTADGTVRTVSQRRLLHADGSVVHAEVHQSFVVERGRRVWMAVLHDVTGHRREADEQRRLSFRDELTGLPNRAAVMELLSELVLDRADESSLALALCDVDRFQRVNDSLGHAAGDELLVALAAGLLADLALCCTAGRMSGDEFVVVCCDVAFHGGPEALGAQLAGVLRRTVDLRGQDVRVSAAVGVAVAAADSSPTDLLRHADAAMYRSKRTGPGTATVAGGLLRTTATHQVQLESELRAALLLPAGPELQVHYQPVITSDGTIVGAEALLRWQHPRLGMVLPGQLLPVAEQGALLRELDEWVLRTVAAEAATWPGQVSVAVNLSGLYPGDPDFVAVVEAAVVPTGLPWSRLLLELVETRLVDLSDQARAAMEVLVERGAQFAVDDFGTGYSSLARLKELPVQVLKVDRTFVAGVGRDPSDFAVVRAVVDLARAMGRTCVAEGVETVSQLQVLRSMGVDAYQGFLFSRAVDSAGFRALLAHGRLDVAGPPPHR